MAERSKSPRDLTHDCVEHDYHPALLMALIQTGSRTVARDVAIGLLRDAVVNAYSPALAYAAQWIVEQGYKDLPAWVFQLADWSLSEPADYLAQVYCVWERPEPTHAPDVYRSSCGFIQLVDHNIQHHTIKCRDCGRKVILKSRVRQFKTPRSHVSGEE